MYIQNVKSAVIVSPTHTVNIPSLQLSKETLSDEIQTGISNAMKILTLKDTQLI